MLTEERVLSFEYTTKVIPRRGTGKGSLTNSTTTDGMVDGASSLSGDIIISDLETAEEKEHSKSTSTINKIFNILFFFIITNYIFQIIYNILYLIKLLVKYNYINFSSKRVIHIKREKSMSENVRIPAVAGQFYDGDEESLKKTLENCFYDSRGPGEIPKISKGNKKILGLVVPHAGYIFSGPIAAHSFHTLGINGFADIFIILGPNHTGRGSGVSVMTKGFWKTPLGTVPINKDVGEALRRGIIDEDPTAHTYEHSIEVQLPFLQFIADKVGFNFVPICMSMQDYDTSKEVGEIMAEAIKNQDKRIVIIASSDFSHVGFNYMNMPPENMRADEYAEKQDMLAIDQILKLNPRGLIEKVHEKSITMCGYGPVAAMLTAAKKLGAIRGELLKYGTSYEVHPSTSCVGYGAIAIY